MYKSSKPSVFTAMSRMDTSQEYRKWKKKEDPSVPTKLNVESNQDFPDLVKSQTKKTVFEGVSLANKLKEVIAAEEEAAILKRLKKGDTPEMLLREQCVCLPLKGKKKSLEPLEVPDWVTDASVPVMIPPFRHRSLAELAEERYWKRLGINPKELSLYDAPPEAWDEDYDEISLPSSDDSESEEEYAEMDQS